MPSDEQRALVRRLAAEGAGHRAIASEIGISVPTLRKALGEELKDRLGETNLFTAAGSAAPVARRASRRTRKGAGGRRPYKPATGDRDKVSVLVASGMTIDEIARAMALSEPTLRRHFAAELETGALRKRAEMLMALHRTALKGNVSAQKEVLAIMDRAVLEELQSQVRGKAKQETAPAPEQLGKKVQADLDAHGVVMHGPWSKLVRVPDLA